MIAKEINWRRIKHHKEIYLFIIPTLALVAVFLYYPSASGIYHSFFRWNAADISEYVGFDNYIDLVKSADFWNSFRVAFILGAWAIIKMIPPLLVAICIHRCSSARVQFFYRALFVVPMVIPPLVTVLIWKSFFFEATNGYLNRFLSASGLFGGLCWLDAHLQWGGIFVAGQNPAWLGDSRLILTAGVLWGFPWVGSFAVLTHLAKLQGIDRQIYEAADIDGVSWFTKFTRIELPMLTGSIYVLLVFAIIQSIKDAASILLLAGYEGGPGGVVTVPALFMLRKAFMEQRLGYACAVGIILTIVVMGLQKLTAVWVDWEILKRWQRLTYRISLIALGGVLYYFDHFLPLALLAFVLALPSRYTATAAAAWGLWLFRDSTVLFAGSALLLLFAFPYAQTARALTLIGPIGRLWKSIDRARQERRARRLQRTDTLRTTLRQRIERLTARVSKHAVIWAVLLIAMLPVYLMLIVSVKDNTQFYKAPAVITSPMHWDNWTTAWRLVGPSVANSIYISTLGTAMTLFLALCGAYFFARLKVPLSGFFWNAILILMMMPTVANLVPLFRLLSTMGMLNHLTTLVILGASSGQIMAIFVLRSFISDIPQDLFEAAEIDGAGHFRQVWTVVLPLSGPILGTVGVMQFIAMWNEFIMALVVMRDATQLPVMVALMRLAGEYIKLMGPMMAGYAIASVPIIVLFIFSMRLYVRGMTEGAVKA